MDVVTPKENIFKRIREALVSVPMGVIPMVDLESQVYPEIKDDEVVVFAENFAAKGGRLVYCEDAAAAVRSLHELTEKCQWDGAVYCADEDVQVLLDAADIEYACKPIDAVLRKVGFCACQSLIAGEGSLVFDKRCQGGRIFAAADVLVFVAMAYQVVADIHLALQKIRQSDHSSEISIWTGLSRFVDVDGNTLEGLGPKEVYLILIDNILG